MYQAFPMQVCIHRGAREIGGNCVELASSGRRIIIDLGLPLDVQGSGTNYLSDIPGLINKENSLLAIIISHPHLDHFGLLSSIHPGIPVIMGADARRLINNASPFLRDNWVIPSEGQDLQSGKSITIGPFIITPYLVDHSGYDSYSLLIEADGKRLFYSGDFRIHGRKAKLTEKLMSNPPIGIDVLLLEGSTLGRNDSNASYPNETEIENQLLDVFHKTSGLAMVHVSSQNIDRIVSIFRACKRSDRTLIIDLYTAVVLEATGNKNIPQSDWPGIALYIPQSQRVQIKNKNWFDLLKKHSKKRVYIENLQEAATQSVLLFRPLHMPDLEKAQLLMNSSYIYSLWEGYWEQDSYYSLREWISKNNIQRFSIHTSGHASPADIKRFAEALKPSKIVPIHTFVPERYKDIFDNVQIFNDGEFYEL